MTDLYRLLPEEMEEMVLKLGYPRYRADQILQALYHESPENIDDLCLLPKKMRDDLKTEGYYIGSSEEIFKIVSKDGDTTKILLKLNDGTLLETVLIQYKSVNPKGHPRSTVCVSTQVGCAMGCVFCATGQMGFERNIKAEEIVTQVIHFAKLLQKRDEHITNIVFMGMGEPLANYEEVLKAVKILTNPKAFGIGQRSITISTIGIIRAINQLAEEKLQIGLAISLHAPNNKLRRSLVPSASPHSVKDLIAAGKRYFKKTGRRVTFEYAMISGINDKPEIANELARLLKNNGSHVNLIPVNPTAGNFKKPPKSRVIEFEQILLESGVNCTVRVEKGSEISAACGQLRTDILEHQKVQTHIKN